MIENDAVDDVATVALRSTHPIAPLSWGHFDLGPGRRAHEAKWTPERYDALVQRTPTVPDGVAPGSLSILVPV